MSMRENAHFILVSWSKSFLGMFLELTGFIFEYDAGRKILIMMLRLSSLESNHFQYVEIWRPSAVYSKCKINAFKYQSSFFHLKSKDL